MHLAAKARDASEWFSARQSEVREASVPLAKGVISTAYSAADTGEKTVQLTRQSPELVGGTVLSLALVRYLGWKGRALLATGLVASWVAFAPNVVSAAAKVRLCLMPVLVDYSHPLFADLQKSLNTVTSLTSQSKD